jgi:magnesium transporter
MDVESAMLLSRARSGSIHNTHPSLGVAVQHSHPHPHPGHTYESPLDTDFPMLSQREEDEMTLARGEYDAAPVVTAYDDIESESAIPHRPASPERSGAATPVKEPHLQSSGFGLSRFDFTPMEEFAAEERRKFGISSPTAPTGGLEDLRRRMQAQKTRQAAFVEPPTDLEAQSEVGNATATEDGDKFQKLRQRTLSQSHPKPRARSRKLAQFEGDVGAPPPSLLYPSTPGPSVSFGDGTTSRPDMLRIDSTAQSRPYRFSFYSNSQASTIHSRSICELPAEGQSFEQLFQGITDKNHLAFPSEAGQSQSSTRVPSAADSHFAPRVQRYSAIPKEEDLPTWWLDVLAPTDEEMRMFSKVRHLT